MNPQHDSNNEPIDIFDELRPIVYQRIAEKAGITVEELMIVDKPPLEPGEVRETIEVELDRVLAGYQVTLSVQDRKLLLDQFVSQRENFGPLESRLDDPSVARIWVRDFQTAYIERKDGAVELISAPFDSEQHLLRFLGRLQYPFHRDMVFPLIEILEMPDGNRLTIGRPPVAAGGAFAVFERLVDKSRR